MALIAALLAPNYFGYPFLEHWKSELWLTFILLGLANFLLIIRDQIKADKKISIK